MDHTHAASGTRRWAWLREGLTSQLWPLPALAVVGAVVLGILLPLLDAEVDHNLPVALSSTLFSGGTDAARAVLSAIAGSLITVTSLTFSLTIVALQLSSSQASPRLLRLFASDRVVHATLALFLGTFAFSLTVLRSIADSEDGPFVPRISVTLASLLTFASVIMLTLFLGHLTRQLRVETMLRNVHKEVARTIELIADTPMDGVADRPDAPDRPHTTLATTSGFLTLIDRHRLLDVAKANDIVVAELHPVGDSIIEGTPLAHWWPRDSTPATEFTPDDRDRIDHSIAEAHRTAYERTPSQDAGLGLRQLADVAIKALSPGVNDPTTAVHALSHITAVLRKIASLPPEPAALTDDEGTPRLIQRGQEYASLVEVALEQIRRYGAGDAGLVERLYRALAELAYDLDPQKRPVIREQLERLDASVAAQDYDPIERQRFAQLAQAVEITLT